MSWFRNKQEKLDRDLRVACSKGHDAGHILRLISEGADINGKDSYDNTPLVWAINSGQLKTIELLLSKGASPLTPNAEGDTPLMSACGSGKPDIVAALLKADASNINQKNPKKYNRTAMHCVYNEPAIVPLLVKAGADINAQNDAGETLLHTAAAYGRFSLVKVLIDNDADPSIRNNDGNLPEEEARRNKKDGLANYLKALTAPPPAPAVANAWKITAPDEIAHVSDKPGTDYRLTEIFNFTARTYTQIARNLKTNAESQSLKFFDEFADKTILDQAHQELLKQGGKAAATAVRRAMLNKKSLP